MSRTLRWGILGPGHIASAQAADLVGSGFTVTAVGSRSEASAREFADRFGIPTAHGSYAALVADPEVDVVYVATPHSFHYAHARLALEAGKHVLVEKSFTVTGDQAQVLVDLAAERGLVILEAMWTRFLPHMVRMREIIAAGTIGEVRSVIADHNQKLPTDPAHRLNNPDLAGGALLDLGIYPVSLASDVLGTPTTVHAEASFTATGVDRQTSIMLGYAGGATAILQTSLDTPGPVTASIIGTEGWIELASIWYEPCRLSVYSASRELVETFEADVPGRGMQFQAAELERLVAAGEASGQMLPTAESVAIMRTLDEVRRQIGLDYPAVIMGV